MYVLLQWANLQNHHPIIIVEMDFNFTKVMLNFAI